MDESISEGDITMSPSQILERLEMLRHLQLLQRGKMQKKQIRLEFAEQSTTATEIVSHFSNSASYNTFCSLLDSPRENETEDLHGISVKGSIQRNNSPSIMEGISALNLSQESEFITNSPLSTGSASSEPVVRNNVKHNIVRNKHISLDEMPIISPRKDFESLIIQKLQSENVGKKNTHKFETISETAMPKVKRSYLKRGEGMSRFGIQKHNLVIQNTKSLPWRQKTSSTKDKNVEMKIPKTKLAVSKNEVKVTDTDVINTKAKEIKCSEKLDNTIESVRSFPVNRNLSPINYTNTQEHKCVLDCLKPSLKLKKSSDNSEQKSSEPAKKGKTWAAILSDQQSDLLRRLKQSDYYKNFHSPCKSTVSDTSCSEYNSNLNQEKEIAEQNLFELMEQKVTHGSFNIENSFFNRFIGKNVDDSGESTPLILRKCISDNPKLTHISLGSINNLRCESSCTDVENCCSEYSETCSTISSCCSCKTVTQNDFSHITNSEKIQKPSNEKVLIKNDNEVKQKSDDLCLNECVNNKTELGVNMVEMNAKLIATSDLLKDRLKELEDEIETFRKENANLNKIREELDLERQHFYEEKRNFEQKFNEEKILSDYYLAEEKEKLQKQKQTYERYVRDIRGRLNKKEKDEIVNLRKEIQDLKEEIKNKDAKSTSIIARLRNQMKIIEKDKKNSIEEMEKLKKENRRIQHSNEITRRLTNLKYLENINKKLSHMTNKDTQIDVVRDTDVKYKSYTIERQSRLKNIQTNRNKIRPRAKSVPNLNVTSRYAKYFSQKDSLSDMEKYNILDNDPLFYKNECSDGSAENIDVPDLIENENNTDEENNIEQIYIQRFKGTPSFTSKNKSGRIVTTSPNTTEKIDFNQTSNDFFIRKGKTNSSDHLKTLNDSLSTYINDAGSLNSHSFSSRLSKGSTDCSNKSIDTREMNENHNLNLNLGETSDSNSTPTLRKSTSSIQNSTSFNRNLNCDSRLIPSPEPTSTKSSTSKTILNPIEITKSDGSRELRFPNGNVKMISADSKYSKFIYYNGDIKENFYKEGKIKYFYAETKTYHTSHADGLEVLEFPDGQIEKRYKDGSTEIRLPNGSVRYYDPKNEHVQEEWRFPDGSTLTVSANGEQRIKFANGQIEVHDKDHKRREFPDGTVKLVYNDGTSETRYASGRIRIKDKHGQLIMDSAPS